jgi:membrane protein YdbS with pleckstrin-like domain
MMFDNPEIAIDDLPDAEDLDWQALHPLYARLIRLQAALGLAVIAIAISALNVIPNLPLLPILVAYLLLVGVGALVLVWPSLSVPRRGYVLRDKDILFRKGVLWQSVTAIPFNRIQHVETSSTPFDRRYALATLQLFTAGGSSGDLKIDGLGQDVAEDLRVFILGRTETSIERA